MERPEETRQRVGRVGAAADRAVVQRLAGNPRHHGPVLGEALRRFTEPHREGHRERQARGQHREPLPLLELEFRGGVHALHAHGQLVPEAPHLVAPAARHLADGQPRKVWMLLLQQVAHQVCGDLDLGVGHATSQY